MINTGKCSMAKQCKKREKSKTGETTVDRLTVSAREVRSCDNEASNRIHWCVSSESEQQARNYSDVMLQWTCEHLHLNWCIQQEQQKTKKRCDNKRGGREASWSRQDNANWFTFHFRQGSRICSVQVVHCLLKRTWRPAATNALTHCAMWICLSLLKFFHVSRTLKTHTHSCQECEQIKTVL